MITWSYWLDRYELLFSAEGAIFGAAFTDLNARLPALYILIGVGTVIGILLLANAWFRSPRIIVGGVGLWIAVAVVVGALYPALVQRFQVAPNELDREREYIPRNIEFTRQGFALDRIVEEDYQLAHHRERRVRGGACAHQRGDGGGKPGHHRERAPVGSAGRCEVYTIRFSSFARTTALSVWTLTATR